MKLTPEKIDATPAVGQGMFPHFYDVPRAPFAIL
jgi:hypothetical protein